MKKFDTAGRTLCDLQASIFAKSVSYSVSSPVFIRRFMNSEYCRSMDNSAYLLESDNTDNVFDILDQEYGKSSYGKEKYSANELTWIGYIYRYWAYVYELSSKQVYKAANGRDMHKLYFAYHSLDPGQAVERILEAKGISYFSALTDQERIDRGVAILRKQRAKFK